MIAVNSVSNTQPSTAMVQNGYTVDEDEEDRLVIDTPNEDLLQRQVNGTSKTTTYTCRVCSKEYKSYRDCMVHETSHGVTRMCNTCNKPFTDMLKLAMHIRAHNRIFPCKFCDESYGRMRQLKQHLKERHKCTEIVRCTICNFTTPNVSTYRVHILSHKECKNQTVVCAHCTYQTKDHDLYQKHLATEHKSHLPKCKYCSEQFPSANQLNQHKKLCKEESLKFQCKICSKKFASEVSQEKHEHKVHYALKNNYKGTFKCFHCDKMLRNLKQLRAHELKHRKMESPHKCQYCNEHFIREKTLITHIEMAHRDGENFICLICNFLTPDSLVYKEHSQTHRDEHKGQESS